ncbi:MAG: hypothetical protein HUJ25_10745 [Crocinitomicaceae bacterium]|nr:hypothetical protein [Crocinitomicaceae bacterium]
MNLRIRQYIGAYILTISSFFLSTAGIAQPPSGSPPVSPPCAAAGSPCWDTECIPIDGGIVFLIIAGALLGVKIIYNMNSKLKNKEV